MKEERGYNRHEITNAAFLVDGYFFPSPTSRDGTFARAKRECLENMARTMACVEALTEEEMAVATGKTFPEEPEKRS